MILAQADQSLNKGMILPLWAMVDKKSPGQIGLKKSLLETFCVSVKRITLYNDPCSSSPSTRVSDSLIQNIEDFGAKNYFTDYRTANKIHGLINSVLVLKIHVLLRCEKV